MCCRSSSILFLTLTPFRLQCPERLAQRRLGRDALAAVVIVAVDLEGADVVAALAVNAIAPQPDEVIAKLRQQSLHHAPRSSFGFGRRFCLMVRRVSSGKVAPRAGFEPATQRITEAIGTLKPNLF